MLEKEKPTNPESEPELFKPSPNLDGKLNEAIIETELQGGLKLESLPEGAKVEVTTEHGTKYLIEKREDGYYISGHPTYCPEPTKVSWIGSVWDSSTSIMIDFIGREMNLQFRLPYQENKVNEETGEIAQPFITTSPIKYIKEVK